MILAFTFVPFIYSIEIKLLRKYKTDLQEMLSTDFYVSRAGVGKYSDSQ